MEWNHRVHGAIKAAEISKEDGLKMRLEN